MGTALNALQVLVKIGYVGSATGFDVGAALGLLEVIPPVPLVAARLPAVALTGFLSGLTLRDLLAVASDVVWARLAGKYPKPWASSARSCLSCSLLVTMRHPDLSDAPAAEPSARRRSCSRRLV